MPQARITTWVVQIPTELEKLIGGCPLSPGRRSFAGSSQARAGSPPQPRPGKLAWGTAEDVRREVRRLELFPQGGLFLGPTHAVQVGSPLENILTMYREAGSLCDRSTRPSTK